MLVNSSGVVRGFPVYDSPESCRVVEPKKSKVSCACKRKWCGLWFLIHDGPEPKKSKTCEPARENTEPYDAVGRHEHRVCQKQAPVTAEYNDMPASRSPSPMPDPDLKQAGHWHHWHRIVV